MTDIGLRLRFGLRVRVKHRGRGWARGGDLEEI